MANPRTDHTTAKSLADNTTANPRTNHTTANSIADNATAHPRTDNTTANSIANNATANPRTDHTTEKPLAGNTTASPSTENTTKKRIATNTLANPKANHTTGNIITNHTTAKSIADHTNASSTGNISTANPAATPTVGPQHTRVHTSRVSTYTTKQHGRSKDAQQTDDSLKPNHYVGVALGVTAGVALIVLMVGVAVFLNRRKLRKGSFDNTTTIFVMDNVNQSNNCGIDNPEYGSDEYHDESQS